MIELCCDYFSPQYVLKYVIIMSRTGFRMNLNLNLLEFQETPWPKQARYLKLR